MAALWLIVPSVVMAKPHSETKIPIVYPGPDSVSGEDNRNYYYIELLRHALVRAGDRYRLVKGARGASSTRQFQLLQAGELDVNWNFSDPKWTPYFRQIDFPIDRGLIGWRLALVRSDHKDILSHVNTLEDLKAFPLAQGQAWQDTQILKSNGLPVAASSSYEGIFHMLAAGHIDYFPRSILEIQGEIESHKNLPLAVDSHLLIYYQNAFYFFVNKNNPSLAQDIEKGLRLMYDSGEFDTFFMKYNGSFIRAAHLEKRRVIPLKNTLMSVANLKNLQRYGLGHPEVMTSQSER